MIAAILDALLIHTLRSSMLVGGVALLLSHTGAWQYFASSFVAHDVQRTAQWESGHKQASVIVVAIDDEGYQNFFGSQSPLNRERVRQLLQTVQASAPSVRRIAVDIDLSPVSKTDVGQSNLDKFLQVKPALWVLPAVRTGNKALAAEQDIWRKRLCASGVGFAHPYLPTEFGYPKLTHQFVHSFADNLTRPATACTDPDLKAMEKPMPLSPAMLSAGVVIPFGGDLKALGETLKMMDPEWIIVGGAWGSTDIFATPFGDRFGVQIHAAALAGILGGHRLVPYWVQLLGAWFFVALLSALSTYLLPKLQQLMTASNSSMSGHQFFLNVVQPSIFVIVVSTLTLGCAELLSILHAETGVWSPSTLLATNVLVYMLLVWNWGKSAVRPYEGPGQAWRKLLVMPLRADIASIGASLRVLWHGPQSDAWGGQSGNHAQAPVGRGRALLEASLASASLAMQTLIPTLAFVYALGKPL